jgi:hypothetical protein
MDRYPSTRAVTVNYDSTVQVRFLLTFVSDSFTILVHVRIPAKPVVIYEKTRAAVVAFTSIVELVFRNLCFRQRSSP